MKRSLLAVTIALLVAASAASAGSVPAKPPVVKSQIWLVLQGQKLGPATSVTIVGADGDLGTQIRVANGTVKTAPLTIRHLKPSVAVTSQAEVGQIRDVVAAWTHPAQGKTRKQTVQLELDSPAGARIAAWTLTNAIPTKVQFGTTPNGHPKVALTFATSSISVVK